MALDVHNLRLSFIMNRDLSFWGYLAFSIPTYVSDAYPTAACLAKDPAGKYVCITLNEGYMGKLTFREQQYIYVHEILHYLNRHFLRMGERSEDKWNTATDMVINEMINSMYRWGAGPKMPSGLLVLPERLKNLGEEDRYGERIYELLEDDEVAGGIVHLWADLKGIPDDLARAKIADAIEAAGKMAGEMPSEIKKILDGLLDAKVNWKAILRHNIGIGRKCGHRLTYSRWNRRFGPSVPGRRPIRRGKLVTIIDSSGSITDEELHQFMTEVDYQNKIDDVTVVVCDAKVHQVFKYRRGMKLEIKGRGGTNMNPGLEVATKLKAHTVVILTDGYLFEDPIKTKARQVWCLTPGGSDRMLKGRPVVKMT